MLRSHSHYCSGLYQRLLAIVNLLCKFLAAVFVHVFRTLAAAIRVMPAKITHSGCSRHLQKKKIGSQFHASTQGGPSHNTWNLFLAHSSPPLARRLSPNWPLEFGCSSSFLDSRLWRQLMRKERLERASDHNQEIATGLPELQRLHSDSTAFALCRGYER